MPSTFLSQDLLRAFSTRGWGLQSRTLLNEDILSSRDVEVEEMLVLDSDAKEPLATHKGAESRFLTCRA